MSNIIGYCRVEKSKKETPRISLDEQQSEIERYAEIVGFKLLWVYREVSDLSDETPPELHKASSHARRSNAGLVVTSLDRLAHSVRLVAELLNKQTKIVSLDLPDTTPLVIQIKAAFVEHEYRQLQKRTYPEWRY